MGHPGPVRDVPSKTERASQNAAERMKSNPPENRLGPNYYRILPWLGMPVGGLAMYWVLRGIDPAHLVTVFSNAAYFPLLLLPLSVLLEQWLRAIKWRLLLARSKRIGTLRLLGAIMAGYLSNILAPLGISPFVRGWLIARLEGLPFFHLLATVVVDRLADASAFLLFAVTALMAYRFPAALDSVQSGFFWGMMTNLALISALTAMLVGLKFYVRRPSGKAPFVFRWVPRRVYRPLAGFTRSFLGGVQLPETLPALLAIAVASIGMKLIALSYFILAGMAFNVMLPLLDYLVLMVFLGFLNFFATSLKIVGGFTAGAVFALGVFGVEVETALAMTLAVLGATQLTVIAGGAVAFWAQGTTLADLKSRTDEP